MRLDLFLRRKCDDSGKHFEKNCKFGWHPFDGQTIFDIQWKVKPLTETELATDSLRVDLNYVSVRNLPKSLVHA
jgi:hypothetical protein